MKIGNQSFLFNNVYIEETATVTGPKEALGPLGSYYDYSFADLHMNEESWEKAEQALLKEAIDIILKKTHYKDTDIDMAISGDLINQNVITNYCLRDYNIPVLGIYGACSTAILGALIGGIFVDSHNGRRIISSTSSHYADSERQYRNPTEYGGPKPETSTSTVSGASAALISSDGKIKLEGGTMGRVIDVGANNPFDMGSAMAPAAAMTLKAHFEDFKTKPSDYDLILTGDLSSVGKPIVREILNNYGYNIEDNHEDAGLMVYNPDDETVFAGGSGCACIGIVSFGYIYQMLKRGKYKRVLLCGTGALLNPLIINQKETIPAIAHAIVLRSEV